MPDVLVVQEVCLSVSGLGNAAAISSKKTDLSPGPPWLPTRLSSEIRIVQRRGSKSGSPLEITKHLELHPEKIAKLKLRPSIARRRSAAQQRSSTSRRAAPAQLSMHVSDGLSSVAGSPVKAVGSAPIAGRDPCLLASAVRTVSAEATVQKVNIARVKESRVPSQQPVSGLTHSPPCAGTHRQFSFLMFSGSEHPTVHQRYAARSMRLHVPPSMPHRSRPFPIDFDGLIFSCPSCHIFYC